MLPNSNGGSRAKPSSRRADAPKCSACKIRDASVCAALTPEELERLAAITSEVRFGPRQTIFQEGDRAEHVYNVTDGTVEIYKLLSDGRRQITGFLFPGDFLGLALNDTYAYTAEAIGSVVLCRFPRLKLEALLEEFPKMEKRLLAIASNELAAAQDQMLLLGRKTAEERVASFLIMFARRAARRGQPDENVIPLAMSRTDIADCLGLTIETVSRTLTRLKKAGIISLGTNGRVTIERRAELERVAEGS